MKKIVSHKPPHHADDFFALSVIKDAYPDSEIEYVAPQEVPSQYFTDKKTILIDVGGRYEPENENYDHHQNKTLACSLIMVLMKLQKNRYAIHPVMGMIDLIDNLGAVEAGRKTSYVFDRNIDSLRKTILSMDIEKYYKEIASAFYETLNETQDYNTFWRSLYDKLDRMKVLEEAKEIMRKQEEDFQRKLKKIKKVNVDGLSVLLSDETLAPNHYRVFQQTKADLIVETNSMNPNHTSVIRNSLSPKAKEIDLSNLKDTIFCHKSGFIAVVNKPFNQFDIKKDLKPVKVFKPNLRL